jgi:hypothetical protein
MVLLLLGLAFLLATSSSLLATSGSGREDEGGSNPPKNDYLSPGEISGSVSVTALGELWLTIFIENLSILAQIEVVDRDNDRLAYKFTVAGIAELVGSSQQSTFEKKPSSPPEVLFSNPTEATERLVELMKGLGFELTKESLLSAPFAVQNGWRSPEVCKKYIQSILDGYERE